MSSLRAPAAIAVLSLALTGCAGGSADLEGRTFTATGVRGHDLVEGSAITLAFEDGQVSANAGCNTIFGEAQWDGGTLEAEQLASTLMACDDALMAQDEWLTALLTSSPTLSVDGTTLTIGDATGLTLTEEE